MTPLEKRLNDCVLLFLLRQEDAGQCPQPEVPAPEVLYPEADAWDGAS